MQFPPAVERWRSIVARYFPPELVDKALWVIQWESSGNPGAAGDGGVARGLFQIQDNRAFPNRPSAEQLDDPEFNIRYAAQQLGAAGGDFRAWGENNTYQGRPFGALGNHPFPGGAANGRAETGSNVSFGGPSMPDFPPPTTGSGTGPGNGDWREGPDGVVYIWSSATSRWEPTQIRKADVDAGKTTITTAPNGHPIAIISDGGYTRMVDLMTGRPPTSDAFAKPGDPPPNQQSVSFGGKLWSFNPATGTYTDSGAAPAPTPNQLGQANNGAPFTFNPTTGQMINPLTGQPITDPAFFTQNSALVDAQIAQIQENVRLAQQQLTLAARNQDFDEYQFATTRLDNAAAQANSFSLAIAGLAQNERLAGLSAQLQAATTNATLAAQAARDEAQMRFASVEADRMRAFQAGEGTANRSLTYATAKAQYGLQKQQIFEQRKRDALAAAKQFSEVISSTDPNAFRAFLAGGGGVIANAMAGGGDALSDYALLPAARTLRTISTPPEDIPDFTWTDPGNAGANLPPAQIPSLANPPQVTVPGGFGNPPPPPVFQQPPNPAPFVPSQGGGGPAQPPPYTAPPVLPRPNPQAPGTPTDPAHVSPTPPVAPGSPGSHFGVPLNAIRAGWNNLTTGTGGDFDVGEVDSRLEVWDAARNQRITSGNLRAGTPYWFRAPTNWVPTAAAGGSFGAPGWHAKIVGDDPDGTRTGHEELSLAQGPQVVVPLNEEGQQAAGMDPQQGRALQQQYLGGQGMADGGMVSTQGRPLGPMEGPPMGPLGEAPWAPGGDPMAELLRAIMGGRQPGQGAYAYDQWGAEPQSMYLDNMPGDRAGAAGIAQSMSLSQPPLVLTEPGVSVAPRPAVPMPAYPPPDYFAGPYIPGLPPPPGGPTQAPGMPSRVGPSQMQPAGTDSFAGPYIPSPPPPVGGPTQAPGAPPKRPIPPPLPPVADQPLAPAPKALPQRMPAQPVQGMRGDYAQPWIYRPQAMATAAPMFSLNRPPSIVPRAATGGIYDMINQAMNTAIAPEDQQYLDIIRQFRMATDYPRLNPFASNFQQTTSPTIRELFFKGRQGRYGIPVQDQEFEQRRFQPMGIGRGGVRVGV